MKQIWHNLNIAQFVTALQVRPKRFFQPETTDEVEDIVRDAHAKGLSAPTFCSALLQSPVAPCPMKSRCTHSMYAKSSTAHGAFTITVAEPLLDVSVSIIEIGPTLN